jgi:hypothetical protein
VWTHQLNEHGKPLHLYTGSGLAWWFYEHLNHDTIAGRIMVLQRFQLTLCLVSALIMSIFYWRQRRNIHYRLFLLASFKVYLTIFLTFVQIPYTYLMITGVFVSVAIFSEQLRYGLATRNITIAA